jgi:hypothetical protein
MPIGIHRTAIPSSCGANPALDGLSAFAWPWKLSSACRKAAGHGRQGRVNSGGSPNLRVVEGTCAFRGSCLLTRESPAGCGFEKKRFLVRFLGAVRCGFDSHHPLQSPPRPANDSQDRAPATRLSRARRRWPSLATSPSQPQFRVSPRRYRPDPTAGANEH